MNNYYTCNTHKLAVKLMEDEFVKYVADSGNVLIIKIEPNLAMDFKVMSNEDRTE